MPMFVSTKPGSSPLFDSVEEMGLAIPAVQLSMERACLSNVVELVFVEGNHTIWFPFTYRPRFVYLDTFGATTFLLDASRMSY